MYYLFIWYMCIYVQPITWPFGVVVDFADIETAGLEIMQESFRLQHL